jgi:hypothetical protein
VKQTSNPLFSRQGHGTEQIREGSGDFVDRIIVVARATIHKSTRNQTKAARGLVEVQSSEIDLSSWSELVRLLCAFCVSLLIPFSGMPQTTNRGRFASDEQSRNTDCSMNRDTVANGLVWAQGGIVNQCK